MSIPVRQNLDLGLSQLLSAVIEVLTSDPGTPTAGRLIFRSDTGELKIGTGSAWVTFYKTSVRLDQITAPTASVGMNGQKLTALADGTAATDAVTKQQLDAVSAGLDAKQSVRAATTANITLSGAQTIDGVSVVAGDRVLVKNQTAPAENGIYVAAAGAWARATDQDAWAEVPGAFVFVEEGTTNADTGWVSTANAGGTLGTTAMPWTQFSAAATGVRKVSADITGNGALTSFAVTHNLATTDVQVQVWEASTNLQVLVETVRTDANTATINFASAPANGKVYRVVAMG